MAFAPVDDPQVAVCVVVEHGAHGNYVGSVARDIFDSYFADVESENEIVSEGTLLPSVSPNVDNGGKNDE